LTNTMIDMMKKSACLLLSSSLVMASAVVAETSDYDWTGAYAGANLGVIWTGSHLTSSQPNYLSGTDGYSKNLDATDVDPGFQFGYLHMLDPHWVVGGEADFTYPATNSQYTVTNGTGTAYDQFNVRNNLQGSLRLRAGYAIDRFLPFVTAGVSWASMGLYYNNESNNAYSKTTAQTGWVLGAGLEYGVLENLTARLEYLYTDYGSALNMNVPDVASVDQTGSSAHADMSTNVFRAAVNYRF
jgi:outer membrane immunogenic protein